MLNLLQSGEVEGVAEAVSMCISKNMLSNLASVCIAPPNEFRADRLYNEEVDKLYKKHLNSLRAIYSRYRLRPANGGLRLKVRSIFISKTLSTKYC